jgi:magnesium-transporting ATPase (P-type)
MKANATKCSDDLSAKVEEIAVLDFSSERKTMSTIVKGYLGSSVNTILLKGAPERVLEKCSSFMTASGKSVSVGSTEKDALAAKMKAVASQGYRVLGFAIGLDGGNMKHITKNNASDELSDTSRYSKLESNLAFVGYICIMDPVRPEVELAIQQCRSAGINVIMITGDAKETAIAIARQLNIISPSQSIASSCFTGAEFEKMGEAERSRILDGHNGKVFCRVEPRHKRELVKVLISKVSQS